MAIIAIINRIDNILIIAFVMRIQLCPLKNSTYVMQQGYHGVLGNVLQLQEVGDFGAENWLPPLNLIRCTKLHLTTEPPIS